MKELEGLMNERDVVGAQLVRRNDEISLLYEKIRILEVTLQRGKDGMILISEFSAFVFCDFFKIKKYTLTSLKTGYLTVIG